MLCVAHGGTWRPLTGQSLPWSFYTIRVDVRRRRGALRIEALFARGGWPRRWRGHLGERWAPQRVTLNGCPATGTSFWRKRPETMLHGCAAAGRTPVRQRSFCRGGRALVCVGDLLFFFLSFSHSFSASSSHQPHHICPLHVQLAGPWQTTRNTRCMAPSQNMRGQTHPKQRR